MDVNEALRKVQESTERGLAKLEEEKEELRKRLRKLKREREDA